MTLRDSTHFRNPEVSDREARVTLRVHPPELTAWRLALAAFDAGDRGPLAGLLRAGDPIPDDAREALAAIVAGARKPDGRGRHRRKVRSEAEAARAAAMLRLLATLHLDPEAVEDAADREAVEPVEVRRRREREIREVAETFARALGVTPKTLMARAPKHRAR